MTLKAELKKATTEDLCQIWAWNRTVADLIEACVHDLISATARRQPRAPAVSGHDGELNYKQLDEFSTVLALKIVSQGACSGTIIPLCFEKSIWTSVAALAVMKAGAASVLLDPSTPEERLRTIIGQVKPVIILSSHSNQSLVERISDQPVIVVNKAQISGSAINGKAASLPFVSPSERLYVVFTSGSTGSPKGTVITHSNFASGIYYQGKLLKYGPSSRVFDFVSYSFDVAWPNMLQTFAAGGCLCVPSEFERQNDIAGSICRLNANALHITPSVARLIDPALIPGLETLVLGGEPITLVDLCQWKHVEHVFQVYGPAECVPPVVVKELDLKLNVDFSLTSDIGHGAGINVWIADPEDHNNLVGIGCIGEALLEGPLIGQGYLSDHDQTSESFVVDPPWLLQGSQNISGRRGRLYKTGDLVSYHVFTGSLNFVGRKDSQIKINGQRIELGEIEHHLSHELHCNKNQAIAEVITPKGLKNKVIAVFVSGGNEKECHTSFQKQTSDLLQRLRRVLPTYMIPRVFVPLPSLPLTATGKTDRRKLREIGNAMSWGDMNVITLPKASPAPMSDIERCLQQLWASTLGIDVSTITSCDDFFQMGGSSKDVIHMVHAARAEGLHLTVARVFDRPRLCDLASWMSLMLKD